MKRNVTIDFIKGILILLVVIGHVIPGSMSETFPRYFIYSFHMPLFIGLSGFLFHIEKISNLNLVDWLKKYFIRIMLPWLVAVNVYCILNQVHGFRAYISSYVFPYYHLWYGKAYIFYVLLTWLILRGLKNKKYISEKGYTILGLMAIGMILAVVFQILKIDKEIRGWSSFFTDTLQNVKPYYYIFFVLGIALQKYISNVSHKAVKAATFGLCVCMIIEIVLFYYPIVYLSTILLYVMNGCMLLVVCFICQNQLVPRCKFIEWLGRNSYAIYLWHIVGRDLINRMIGKERSVVYSVANVVVFAIMCMIIYFGNKNIYINKILGGEVTKK